MILLKLCVCAMTIAVLSTGTDAWSFQLVDSSKTRADSLRRAALSLHSSGRFADAVSTFLLAGADTGSASDQFNLGLSYAALNDFARANRLLHAAVMLDSGNVGYRFQLARFLAQAGVTREAQTQYEQIIESDSTYIPALFALGMIFNESHSFENAAQMFRRVLALNANDFLSYHNLGAVLVSLVNQDSALVCLSTSLRLNPNFVPAISVLASIHYAKKRYGAALALYEQACVLRPDNADFNYKVALCYRELDNYQRATEAFRKATELDSLNASYFGNLGHAYYRVQKFDSSVFAYMKAISIDRENSIFFVNLALVLQKLDSVQSAANAYRGAIGTYHPNEIADVYVKLGTLYFGRRKYQEAIEAYQSALRFDPANRDAQFYLASAFDDIADIPAAVRNYNKYLKLAENVAIESKRVEWTRIRLRSLRRK